MDKNWKQITDNDLEVSITNILKKTDEDMHRIKFLEFLRDYGIIDNSKIDEIANEFGLEFHKEDNSYWRK